MRYPVLDGFRGFCLIFMMVSHLNAIVQTTFGKINYHPIGWADAAHGFVFLSGCVVGIVYGRRLLAYSSDAMTAAVFARARRIYFYHLALIASFSVLAFVLWSAGFSTGYLVPYRQEQVVFPALSTLLVAGSAHMGILPIYVVFMLATPLALRALASGRTVTVFMTSGFLWLVAQYGVTDAFVSGGETLLSALGIDIKLGIYFDPLGWQILYAIGLYCGFRAGAGTFDLAFLRSPAMENAFKLGLVIFALLAIYDRVVYDQLVSSRFSNAALAAADRGSVAPIYLFAFALDVFLLCWLINAAPFAGNSALRAAGRATAAAFRQPALTLLGRHSLPVFACHIVVVYMVEGAVGTEVPGEFAGALIIIAGCATLYVVPLINERARVRRAESRRTVSSQAR